MGLMADANYSKLTDEEISARMGAVPGWSVENGMLTRLFGFGTYASGVMFASAVGQVADALNHHPDLFVGYQKVRVQTCTHDAENSLTPMDFELAMRINALSQPK